MTAAQGGRGRRPSHGPTVLRSRCLIPSPLEAPHPTLAPHQNLRQNRQVRRRIHDIYQSYPGYLSLMEKDFDRAGEKALR